MKAFGDERFKTRISELESGKVKQPQQKTIDSLVVALDITDDELTHVLNVAPNPLKYDNISAFFTSYASDKDPLFFEVAVKEGGIIVFFYNKPWCVKIKRVEYFVEERALVFLEELGRRKPVGLPLNDGVHPHIVKATEIYLIQLDPKTDEIITGDKLSLKVIH